MKVEVIKEYIDEENNYLFEVGKHIKVEDAKNSDFYHIWKDNKLYLVPKRNCKQL